MADRSGVAIGVGSALLGLGGLADATLLTLDWTVPKPVPDTLPWFRPAVAIATLIGLAGLYLVLAPVMGWAMPGGSDRKERHRQRIGPPLRSLILAGQELQGIASRLTHDPANEAVAAPARLVQLRDELMRVVEPELRSLRGEYIRQIVTLQQWIALSRGAHEDSNRGRPVSPKRYERLDKYEDDEPGHIEELIAKTSERLERLEG